GPLIQARAVVADPAWRAAYGRARAAGEQPVLASCPAATVIRRSIVFGPEDDFFNRFARLARLLPALPLIGGGRTRFQPVYVGDVAAAIVAANQRPAAAGKAYELGGPRISSFKELLGLLLHPFQRDRRLLPVCWGVARQQHA